MLTIVSLALTVPALQWFLASQGATFPQRVAAVLMWILLPPLWERSMKIVHLADAPAMAMALCAAACSGPWAVPFALIAGATRETAPFFAALWAQSPWPLLGLLAVPWWRRGGRHVRHDHLFVSPWKTFSRQRWAHGISIPQYVLPFGGFVAGVTTPWSWLVVAVAAVPLFRAIDTSRLLLWAVPTLAASAVTGATDGMLLAMIAWSVVTTSHWTP